VVGTDPAKSLTRFGGIRVNGGMDGQIVALGNVFGDLTLKGGVTGRIAVEGQAVRGLELYPGRFGILGNVAISGQIGSTAAIVSAGIIGDNGNTGNSALGTHLTSGNDSGILAAEGNINFGKTGSLNTKGLFVNAMGLNKQAIDAIFTATPQGQTVPIALLFDTVVNGQTGLNLILADLAALAVNTKGNLAGPVA